jgi:hypothetical protein
LFVIESKGHGLWHLGIMVSRHQGTELSPGTGSRARERSQWPSSEHPAYDAAA